MLMQSFGADDGPPPPGEKTCATLLGKYTPKIPAPELYLERKDTQKLT